MSACPGSTGITVNATSGGKRSVPIGTGESGIHSNFLNSTPKESAEIGVQIVISFLHDGVLEVDRYNGL